MGTNKATDQIGVWLETRLQTRLQTRLRTRLDTRDYLCKECRTGKRTKRDQNDKIGVKLLSCTERPVFFGGLTGSKNSRNLSDLITERDKSAIRSLCEVKNFIRQAASRPFYTYETFFLNLF